MWSAVHLTVTRSPSFCSCSLVGWQPLHRQRGSVAGLTFPFSCSQRAPARPIHPNRVLLFEGPRGGGDSGHWGGVREDKIASSEGGATTWSGCSCKWLAGGYPGLICQTCDLPAGTCCNWMAMSCCQSLHSVEGGGSW